MQDFRGLYQGTFIIQTFGEHFSAIDGAQAIPGVYDKSSRPRGALALSIAAVCYISIKRFLITNTHVGRAGTHTLGHSHNHCRNGPHSQK